MGSLKPVPVRHTTPRPNPDSEQVRLLQRFRVLSGEADRIVEKLASLGSSYRAVQVLDDATNRLTDIIEEAKVAIAKRVPR